MADYISKYTGDEVDNILDEAIELPNFSSSDTGKFLVVADSSTEGGYPVLHWEDVFNFDYGSEGDFLVKAVYNNQPTLSWTAIPSWIFTEGTTGQYLRMAGGTSHPEWVDAEDPFPSTHSVGDVLIYGDDGPEWNNATTILPAGTNGQYLQLTGNGLAWGDPTLDTSNANDGDVLKYNSDVDNIVWDSLPEGLPTHNSSYYNNSILTINSQGNVDWYGSRLEASDGDVLKYSSSSGIIWSNIFSNSGSNGDVLKYSSNSGAYWGTIDSIPSATDQDDDKFLVYACGAPQWKSAEEMNILPTYDSAHIGQVLAVNGCAELQFMTLSEVQAVYDAFINGEG